MIKGFRVGHYTDLENVTGCTVVLAPPDGAVAGVDVRGFAPGTIGTETLNSERAITRAHAIVLSGGSAFGLDTVAGVMRYLEEHGVGLDVGVVRVPIVAGAILFDLTIGNPKVRPNSANGYEACENAPDNLADGNEGTAEIAEGSVGAGTGATVGKILGMENATKGGIGYAESKLARGIAVGALVAVNAVGDVIDPATAQIIGGARNPGGGWLDSGAFLLSGNETMKFASGEMDDREHPNTTIGVVMTDAALTVEQANIIALMAHDGIARATRPSHTLLDGDTLFVLATGGRGAGDLTMIGHAAAECVAAAITRGVNLARTLGGVRAWNTRES